jgi:hypothetical protein
MNKSRKTSNLYNIITYDDNGNVVLPASLSLGSAPASDDNSLKVGTTSWIRTYISSLSLASSSSVTTAIANLIASAPSTLDTLNELAAALGDDANFAATITASIGTKESAITAGTTSQYWRGDKTWQTLPVYTLSGLGGVPTTRTITINGTAYDLSADRSWSITAGISGSGTTNYLSKWTGSSSLGDSIIYDSGTFVIVGTAGNTGNITFQVNGNARVRDELWLNSTINKGSYVYTLPSATGTLALTSNLSSYLPLSGGTLTGTVSSNSDIRTDGGTLQVGAGSSNYYTRISTAYNYPYVDSYLDSMAGSSYDGRLTFRIQRNNGAVSPMMTILPTGNVGIGTTTPDSGLNINSGATRALRIDTNSGIQGISMSPNSIFGIDEPGLGNTRFIINTNGRVGIGTASPNSKLEVIGDARAGNFGLNTESTFRGGLYSYKNVVGSGTDFGVTIFAEGGTGNGNIYFCPNGSADKVLTLQADGEIIHSKTNAIFTQRGGGGYALVRLYGNSNTVELQMAAHQTSGVGSFGTYTNSDLVFKTNNTERMRISAGGYLTVVSDANLELYKGQTVDMSSGSYSASNFYPVIIGVPNSGVTIQIQNNLNSNLPSWSTHGGGFTLNLKWETNGSGWGTTAVKRKVYQYNENFTNQRICGGITQMTTSSQEVVWLRGGGVYYFTFSRNVSAFASSTTYTNPYGTESAVPSSSVRNDVWNSATGTELYYANAIYADALYTGGGNGYHVSMKPTTGATFNVGSSSGNRGITGPFINATYDGQVNTTAVPLFFNCESFHVFCNYDQKMRIEATYGDMHLRGYIYQGNTSWSDIRMKQNLKLITDPLTKVSQLNGYTFEWREWTGYRNTPEIMERINDAGLIAQEVEAVLPEIVENDTRRDQKSMNYNGVIALHTEAIKELIKQNEALLTRIQELENK